MVPRHIAQTPRSNIRTACKPEITWFASLREAAGNRKILVTPNKQAKDAQLVTAWIRCAIWPMTCRVTRWDQESKATLVSISCVDDHFMDMISHPNTDLRNVHIPLEDSNDAHFYSSQRPNWLSISEHYYLCSLAYREG